VILTIQRRHFQPSAARRRHTIKTAGSHHKPMNGAEGEASVSACQSPAAASPPTKLLE
jgi:hypothetical protein